MEAWALHKEALGDEKRGDLNGGWGSAFLSQAFTRDKSEDYLDDEKAKVSSALHCTQHPGELLYVPRYWGHATLNLAESIGFAVEFAGYSC